MVKVERMRAFDDDSFFKKFFSFIFLKRRYTLGDFWFILVMIFVGQFGFLYALVVYLLYILSDVVSGGWKAKHTLEDLEKRFYGLD
jgi:hypothetical protein